MPYQAETYHWYMPPHLLDWGQQHYRHTQPLNKLSKKTAFEDMYTFPTDTGILTFHHSWLDGVPKCECAVGSD